MKGKKSKIVAVNRMLQSQLLVSKVVIIYNGKGDQGLHFSSPICQVAKLRLQGLSKHQWLLSTNQLPLVKNILKKQKNNFRKFRKQIISKLYWKVGKSLLLHLSLLEVKLVFFPMIFHVFWMILTFKIVRNYSIFFGHSTTKLKLLV